MAKGASDVSTKGGGVGKDDDSTISAVVAFDTNKALRELYQRAWDCLRCDTPEQVRECVSACVRYCLYVYMGAYGRDHVCVCACAWIGVHIQ